MDIEDGTSCAWSRKLSLKMDRERDPFACPVRGLRHSVVMLMTYETILAQSHNAAIFIFDASRVKIALLLGQKAGWVECADRGIGSTRRSRNSLRCTDS